MAEVVVVVVIAVVVMLKLLVAESLGEDESSTLTVKVLVPAVVGLPEITPPAVKVRPTGRLPVVLLQT